MTKRLNTRGFSSTNSGSAGFTLIEIIVSVGIFALVMLVASSAYFYLISLDRQARATNETVNNLTFAVDAMMRGIRTGKNYKCVATGGDDTTGTCSCFTYQDSDLAKAVTYHLMANHSIGRELGSASCLDANASSITDPSITIGSGGLVFYVRGSTEGDNAQPEVVFTVKGTMPAGSNGAVTTFNLEETASQRLIDL